LLRTDDGTDLYQEYRPQSFVVGIEDFDLPVMTAIVIPTIPLTSAAPGPTTVSSSTGKIAPQVSCVGGSAKSVPIAAIATGTYPTQAPINSPLATRFVQNQDGRFCGFGGWLPMPAFYHGRNKKLRRSGGVRA
jgi:hypothetical protein